jgi:shikimate kinase
MNLKLKRTPGLYLVGFTACGKSTVGRHLAERLGWSFFDTNHEIEAAEKANMAQLFEKRGEAELRRIEREVLCQHVGWIERGRPAVIALGGEAFLTEENRELLGANGVTVWLDCPLDLIRQRLARGSHHPPARDPQTFEALYAARMDTYRLADVHVPIEGDDPQYAVAHILAHPLLK